VPAQCRHTAPQTSLAFSERLLFKARENLAKMFSSIVSSICAIFLSFRFWRELKIRNSEAKRYLSKSFNLGLCYGAFVKPTTLRGAVAAGKAAFVSCSYDVVTDWRSFSADFREPFERQLQSLVPSATELTMRLYWSEMQGTLGDDGLERGVIAAEFIIGLVGSEAFFDRFGIRRLGLLLQIVDDIIEVVLHFLWELSPGIQWTSPLACSGSEPP